MPTERPEGSTPPDFAETTPSRYPMPDYSFTLQAVIELKGSVGELKEAVRRLQGDSQSQGTKLDSISHRIYAASAIILLLLGAIGWVLDKIWDVGFELL